jgi:integrase
VPIPAARAVLEHHFALRKECPVRLWRAQGLVKEVASQEGLTKDVTPHVLRHTFAATALQVPEKWELDRVTLSRVVRDRREAHHMTKRTA